MGRYDLTERERELLHAEYVTRHALDSPNKDSEHPLERVSSLAGCYQSGEDYDEILGKHINSLRNERGLTILQVSAALGNSGKSDSWYQNHVARHPSTLSSNEVRKLLTVLECSYEQLVDPAASGNGSVFLVEELAAKYDTLSLAHRRIVSGIVADLERLENSVSKSFLVDLYDNDCPELISRLAMWSRMAKLDRADHDTNSA